MAECEAPYVYMPEHRWRVEKPSDGGMAGRVRGMFEQVSTTILERWGEEYKDTLFGEDAMSWSDGGRVVEDKMLNAVLEQDSFVTAFTGNSIAAGHDCLYEQSYPVLLNETFGKLMEAAGVGYTAFNVAMGNTRVVPYSYCIDAHVGLDADIVTWSFGMEIATIPCKDAAAAVELFIRSSLVLPKRPAVLLMDAQADQSTKAPTSVVTKRNKRFLGQCNNHQGGRDLMEVYRDFGLHSMFASSLILEHAKEDERFSHEKLYKEGKHYPRPMSWHPGPNGHVLIADMLFIHYGRVLVRALEKLDAVAPGLSADQLREKKQQAALREAVGLGEGNQNVFTMDSHYGQDEVVGEGETSPPHEECSYMGGGRGYGVLPPAEWCSSPHCRWTGNYRCANTYFPLAGDKGSRLLDMVVPRPNGGGGQKYVLNRFGEELSVVPTQDRWAVTLNEISIPAIEYMRNGHAPKGFHKPIDVKWVLVGDKGSGPIEFEFFTAGVRGPADAITDVITTDGGEVLDSRVVVCKPDFIDRVEFEDKEGVRFFVDGVETSVAPKEGNGMATISCSVLEAEVGPGRHRLVVEPLRRGEPFVAISHVVYPA
eukprot:g13127.t1